MEFADHALVFMARGIYRKWKQPISFLFTGAGLTAAYLTKSLKQVISNLQDVGLIVVATICDQVPVNATAINNLIVESKRDFFQANREYRGLGFFLNNKEIVPLFDPPHLLKGIRNNMLNGDVQFKWKEARVQVASWKHVINLYDIDVGDEDTKMLTKLTNGHVHAANMKKMKVSVAAQVFSHRVSSTMRFIAKNGEHNIDN